MASDSVQSYYDTLKYAEAVEKVVEFLHTRNLRRVRQVMDTSVLSRFRGTGMCPFGALTSDEKNPVHECVLQHNMIALSALVDGYNVGLESKQRVHLAYGSFVVTPLGAAVVLENYIFIRRLVQVYTVNVNARIEEVMGTAAELSTTVHPLEYALGVWSAFAPIELLMDSPHMDFDAVATWKPRCAEHARKLLKHVRPSRFPLGLSRRVNAVVDRWNARVLSLETFVMADRHDAPRYQPPTDADVLAYTDDDEDDSITESSAAASSSAAVATTTTTATTAAAADADDDASVPPAAYTSFFLHRLFDRNTIRLIADYVDTV